MGHKVNPTGIRLGVIKEHNSVWYADKKEYSKNLLNDIQVREFLDKRLVKASDVPSRYEACGSERHAPGCQGYQDSGRRSSRGC